jgi:hypothetical protein
MGSDPIFCARFRVREAGPEAHARIKQYFDERLADRQRLDEIDASLAHSSR